MNFAGIEARMSKFGKFTKSGKHDFFISNVASSMFVGTRPSRSVRVPAPERVLSGRSLRLAYPCQAGRLAIDQVQTQTQRASTETTGVRPAWTLKNVGLFLKKIFFVIHNFYSLSTGGHFPAGIVHLNLFRVQGGSGKRAAEKELEKDIAKNQQKLDLMAAMEEALVLQ